MATLGEENGPHFDVNVVASLDSVVEDVEAGRLASVAIDMPIALPSDGWRECDTEARRRLGRRRSSVFPAPARSVLGAPSYEEACARSVRACGKKVSKQLFNILPRIAEVDDLMSPTLQSRVFEMCPEFSFAVLGGGPMCANKRTTEGRAERIWALSLEFGNVTALVADPPPGATTDDVLDAIVGAWTAHRQVAGAHVRLGGAPDERCLRMEVIA